MRICSLSGSLNNDLMWSYYANGHKGVVIELQPKNLSDVKLVNYTGISHLNDILHLGSEEDVAREILLRKECFWAHEQEFRIITMKSYVPVKIIRVIIGSKVNPQIKSILKKLLCKLSIDFYEK